MFAAIASGNPLQLSEEVPDTNGLRHTLVLSSTKPKTYSHISLFILPNVTFPVDFVATVYFKLGPEEDFKLFGYLSLEKPSAMFKVRLSRGGASPEAVTDGLGEIDMDEDVDGTTLPPTGGSNISQLIIGISIEPRAEGLARLEQWKAQLAAEKLAGGSVPPSSSSSLVVAPRARNVATAGQLARLYPSLTQELAGKIVQHAYNYLAGFLDPQGNVPIKVFDAWWDKFRSRLSNDAGFLDEVTND
ncbi:Opi10p KNAG_0L00610 [Huiozyma naganishii CBS 8797]|uniref:Uncharacterized protein n=1 Tax=Huiozyma naganishii (strain ATCC MYA-139 / BCRC 22969 / CBS 8797 / KCTC 17520 / NBRC 10181 / NCYC 3082 / Yp74L-3) TaxID=1071383 RepID=J7SAE5_HUIN7|nr:hypothetical protein KNAG_0L00610 [Kazachstania naganishii CBS 8797]CCK72684.1 hypothetical protein KNAG_0L00610 [Kazachstania naganishii CBS 8797]